MPALINAALFLNFAFWVAHGVDLWRLLQSPVDGLVVMGVAAVLTALFFVGPALACRRSGGGIAGAFERALGTAPAVVARVCCAWFVVTWMAVTVSVVVTWQLPLSFNRELSKTNAFVAAMALLAYVFLSGLQGLRTTARLAFFTNKLALAVAIAAAIRVRDGWPAVLVGWPAGVGSIWQAWDGICALTFYVAPLALLAAGCARPAHSRRDVGMLALMGLALPLGAGLWLAGMVAMATGASLYYVPSLQPNIAMALWGKAAAGSLPPRMMIAAITIFGALRFGARALGALLAAPQYGLRVERMLVAGSMPLIAWLSLKRWAPGVNIASEVSTAILAVLAAVLTADAICPSRTESRQIDWVGTLAAVAGVAAALFWRHAALKSEQTSWPQEWLLPSYALALSIALAGRCAMVCARKAAQLRY